MRTISATADGPRSVRVGITAGSGLGGFVDGIALHQIAHWHNMGSARLPPVTLAALKQNMVWDGWFHAAVWILTVAERRGRLSGESRQT